MIMSLFSQADPDAIDTVPDPDVEENTAGPSGLSIASSSVQTIIL